MTPWQLTICVKQYQQTRIDDHDNEVMLLWIGAYFHRGKNPKYQQFLMKKKIQSNKIDEHGIKAKLFAQMRKAKDA